MASDLDQLRERLLGISEELADAGLDRLRAALEAPDDVTRAELAAEEKRLGRARRAVDKAAALLGAGPG